MGKNVPVSFIPRLSRFPMKFIFLICFAFWSRTAFSQIHDLIIEIPNVKSREGVIHIGIYNNKEAFPHYDKEYRVIIIKASTFPGDYTIKDLPEGEYAVALMHDENADRTCNKNFLGIPKEGYGFSNNIRPFLSAPSYNDCKIDLNRNMTITIKLIY